jgi:hypothetical protein
MPSKHFRAVFSLTCVPQTNYRVQAVIEITGNKPTFAKRSIPVQMENSCSPLGNIFMGMVELTN